MFHLYFVPKLLLTAIFVWFQRVWLLFNVYIVSLINNIVPAKSMRGGKPYVPERLHGLGVSNLYNINI